MFATCQLIANFGGPLSRRRRLRMSMAQSILLYMCKPLAQAHVIVSSNGDGCRADIYTPQKRKQVSRRS